MKLPRTKLKLAERVLSGETVVAKVGTALEQWAIENNLAVHIDRRGQWGNPYVMKKSWRDSNKEELHLERDRVCDLFAANFKGDCESLKGKILFCHCAPLRCHGDLLAAIANQRE